MNNRRGFLKMMVAGLAAGAATQFPFRVYSFPTEIATEIVQPEFGADYVMWKAQCWYVSRWIYKPLPTLSQIVCEHRKYIRSRLELEGAAHARNA